MKTILRSIRRHASRLAALALLAGWAASPAAAQQTVTKISGGTGSLANTLQSDLQVANGRTLTISSYGSLIINSGATLSVSGATFTGSFSLSNVTILSGTASLSSLTVSTQTVAGSFRAISPSAGIGYGAGSGSASTQLTDKSTAVTLNGMTGQITLNTASIASATTVSFTMTNSSIVATDVVSANINSASYSARAFPGTGTALFTIKNESGVTASDSPVINFIIIRGSAN